MKLKCNITDITHEDLVILFSTACYGNTQVSASYSKKYYEIHCVTSKEDCWEDKIAKVLLNGGNVCIYDNNAEDENEGYGDVMHVWDVDRQSMSYLINLRDVRKGLASAISYDSWAVTCLLNLIHRDESFDVEQAYFLLQLIMFEEVIY